jgi:hypothetical protein
MHDHSTKTLVPESVIRQNLRLNSGACISHSSKFETVSIHTVLHNVSIPKNRLGYITHLYLVIQIQSTDYSLCIQLIHTDLMVPLNTGKNGKKDILAIYNIKAMFGFFSLETKV